MIHQGRYVLRFPVLACAWMIVCMPACDESLPSRVEPENVIEYGTVSAGSYVKVDHGVVVTSDVISLTAKNLYDDVLSDKARIIGTLTLRLKKLPGMTRTLTYTKDDLWTQSMLSGNIVTMRPGQMLAVARQWNHLTDDGIPFWEFLPHTLDSTGSGAFYYRSDTAWFQVTGSLQVFDKTQAGAIATREFAYVYSLFNTVDPTPTVNR